MVSREKIDQIIPYLSQVNKVTVLTGAGISAESGIPTFRGENGLWKKYRAEELATPQAFISNPALVWEWYDWRRQIISSKKPNPGHETLAKWEKLFPYFHIITQNIDGLHQQAGAEKVIELHGNIWKMRCLEENTVIENRDAPLKEIPPRCPSCGGLLRPHVVWFGESLEGSVLNHAFELSQEAELMLVVGTSAVVQPAASLPLTSAERGTKIIEINPDPTPLTSWVDFSLQEKAGEILPLIHQRLMEEKEKIL
ncbi:MAG: SIR2 family NAD-dependent protein deacylase [Acidobacteriota bacterium]